MGEESARESAPTRLHEERLYYCGTTCVDYVNRESKTDLRLNYLIFISA